MRTTTRFLRTFRLPLLALLAGALLHLAPVGLREIQAQEGSTCSATCARGMSCTATGANCSCTCSLWLNLPVCSCNDQPAEPGGGG